ncbi:hypothetical protein PVAG01_00169 [Phlyctema vagabunda]|uniref:Uncharacterized protein n=1 Tax=Phlyctema vagabunda TaxID=108571 RepID=A0ABR4PTI3_9HELO
MDLGPHGMDVDSNELLRLKADWQDLNVSRIHNLFTKDSVDGEKFYQVEYHQFPGQTFFVSMSDLSKKFPEVHLAWQAEKYTAWALAFVSDGNIWQSRSYRLGDKRGYDRKDPMATPKLSRLIRQQGDELEKREPSGVPECADLGVSHEKAAATSTPSSPSRALDESPHTAITTQGTTWSSEMQRHGSPSRTAQQVDTGNLRLKIEDAIGAEDLYNASPPRNQFHHSISAGNEDPVNNRSVARPNDADVVLAEVIQDSQQALEEEEQVMATQVQPIVTQCEEYSDILKCALSRGIYSLLLATLDLKGMPCDGWVELRKTRDTCSYREFIQALIPMVACIDSTVLEHLIAGDLPRAYHEKPSLWRVLGDLKDIERKIKCPSIYAQYLVNNRGISPNPETIADLLDSAELYIRGRGRDDEESHALAAEVDVAFNGPRSTKRTAETAKQGLRRYIPNDAALATCLKWIEALRTRLSNEPPHSPLTRSLSEVGYATNPTDRLKEHSKHQSSNYLMNLMESLCAVKLLGRYSIWKCVLFQIVDETHGMLGEIICTRFAQAYITQGGGFSHERAGKSVAGVHKMTSLYYSDMKDKMASTPGFQSVMNREMEIHLKKRSLLVELREVTEKEKELGDRWEKLKVDAEALLHANIQSDRDTSDPDVRVSKALKRLSKFSSSMKSKES